MSSHSSAVFTLLSRLVLWLILGAIQIGCASYTTEIRDLSVAYNAGLYPTALEKIEKSSLARQERNQLLFLLEKAMILDRQGSREEARKALLRADKMVDELFTVSVSKEMATYLYNESAQSYPGEDYEKVAIHIMLAHLFLADEDLSAARVEAAKINNRLNEINSFYTENKNRYKEDAYARYLAGIIYESQGEFDSAIVDYKAALRLYEGDYAKHFQIFASSQLKKALFRLLTIRNRKAEIPHLLKGQEGIEPGWEKTGNSAEIVVIHELGRIAGKQEQEFIYPINNQLVRFSFPIIPQVSISPAPTGISVQDLGFTSAELTQNFNSIAVQNLEDRRLRLVAKSAARLILKNQITEKAQKEFGALGWLAGNIYGAVTETADTRSWSLLPAAIAVSRVTVKPGKHNVQLMTNGRKSAVKPVELKPGQIKILRDY